MIQRLLGFFLLNIIRGKVSDALAAAGVPTPVRIALFVLVAVLALVLSMWHWQESILYIPTVPNPSNPMSGGIRRPAEGPAGMRSPSESGLQYEEVFLEGTDGVKAHAWFIPAAARAHAPTLLLSHENAGSMALRLPQIKTLYMQLGCNLLAYDYRGYGDSDTVPINEEGLMRDAHAAWRWLVHQSGVDATRIVLYGASLGGAVSIRLARELCDAAEGTTMPIPMGLALCNTFTSIEAMLGVKFPWLNFPFVRRHMLRLRWMSIEHVKHVKVPILFVVGLQDELVPPQHTRELQRAAAVAPLVRVLEVPDGTHNDTWAKAGATFVRALSDFFAAAGGAVGERSARLKAD